jgi:L-lysine exporter family protein LysE/ArgO
MDLFEPALRGFLLGLGLIVAIGAQNAFVLERGLVRNHVFVVCLVCAVSDALLIAAGVAGLGTLISSRPKLILVVTIGGAIFLGTYALVALRRALRPAGMDVRGGRVMNLWPAVLTVLGLTFLNPHVYLDTVVLLGSLSARYAETTERVAYGLGAATASIVWFFGLGYGARLLAPLFARPSAWRILDGIIAAVMALLALGLVASLIPPA